MRPGKFSQLTDRRISRIMESESFFFWSIKQRKLIKISNDEDLNQPEYEICPLCIAAFDGLYSDYSRFECKFKVESTESLKMHILKRENRWMRELMWPDINEVPVYLDREREIGDLSSWSDEQILRIEFQTVTVVDYADCLRFYFNGGCPCQTGSQASNGKCQVKRLNETKRMVFRHLACLERFHKRYIVFKATVNEITENSYNRNEYSRRESVKYYQSTKSSINEIDYSLCPIKSNSKIEQINSQSMDSQTEEAIIDREIEAPIDKDKEYRTFIIGGRKVEILFDRPQDETSNNKSVSNSNKNDKIDYIDLTVD